jgi:phosphatidylglycerophosphate synthase
MSALPEAPAAGSVPRALVLVAPSGEVAVRPDTPLLGLPLVKRTELAARRAGFEEVLFEGEEGKGAGEEALRLPWNAVVTVEDLRALRAPFIEGRNDDRPAADLAGMARPEPSASGAMGEEAAKRPRGPLFVRTADDLRQAERYLLRSLVKETDSPIARHVNRRLSLFVSRLLAPTNVTPNQMTVICAGIGLLGAACFLSAAPARQLAGALLFLLHSILDGCDGELARLKFLESRTGGVLDFWSDNVVHVAVFDTISVGWSREIGAAWPLGLGALAVLGTLLSAGFVFASTMRRPADSGPTRFVSVTKAPATGVSRVADFLARRDFIYLVLILAAVGEVRWFLVMSAIGAPAFFMVLLAIASRARHAERTPA